MALPNVSSMTTFYKCMLNHVNWKTFTNDKKIHYENIFTETTTNAVREVVGSNVRGCVSRPEPHYQVEQVTDLGSGWRDDLYDVFF